MTRSIDGSDDDGGRVVKDRRARRISALLEMSGLMSRFIESGVVLVVGLLVTWATFDAFGLQPIDQYARSVWLSAVIYALSAELTGCYDLDARFSLRQGWTRVMAAWLGCCIAMLTLAFLMKFSVLFSRGWTIVWFLTVGTSLTVVRAFLTMSFRLMKGRGLFNQRVAILGDSDHGERLVRYIGTSGSFTIDLVGYYDDAQQGYLPHCAALYRGDTEKLLVDVRAGRIDQVMITMPYATDGDLQRVVGQLAMLPVLIRLVPDLSSFAFSGQSMVMLGSVPMMTLFERPISGVDQIVKRLEDLVIGSALLLLATPFLIIVAIVIKLESPGPIFFRQRREGFNHRVFWIWKFRSMHTELLQYDQISQARRGDPRVTKVGRVIRATSIDELPQLINVIIGDMSLVGPRPHAASTRVAGVLFNEATQDYAARHRVKPGITGWAQVNGWRGETDTYEKLMKRIEYDLFYIDHWSVGFDFYIIARTFAALLLPRSAY